MGSDGVRCAEVQASFLGLGIHPVHFPQGIEHVATLSGELVGEAHKLPATVAVIRSSG
jgi:hypothetical protein